MGFFAPGSHGAGFVVSPDTTSVTDLLLLENGSYLLLEDAVSRLILELSNHFLLDSFHANII